MAIWAVSDLHADYRENMDRIESWAAAGQRAGTLLVAGDVSHDLPTIERVLVTLGRAYSRLFFVSGNHELWVQAGEPFDSFAKLAQVTALCARLGVETVPARVDGVWIVPLHSWYDASLAGGRTIDGAELSRWADLRLCRWGIPGDAVARHFMELNEPVRALPLAGPVVTFSHFLPRGDLLPAQEVLRFKALPLVAGDGRLDPLLRGLGSRVHVFGHSHINLDVVIDGVRYVQNALRYPKERRLGAPPHEPCQVWP